MLYTKTHRAAIRAKATTPLIPAMINAILIMLVGGVLVVSICVAVVDMLAVVCSICVDMLAVVCSICVDVLAVVCSICVDMLAVVCFICVDAGTVKKSR